MEITIHRLYYGPVGDKGIMLKTTPALKDGQVLNDDSMTDIYTMKSKNGDTSVDSELLYTARGPVIRVTKITPLQSDDKRTVQSCNTTLLVQLSEISKLLIPLLDVEPEFPLQPFRLKIERDG